MITENPNDLVVWAKKQYNMQVQQLLMEIDGAMADAEADMETTIVTTPSSIVEGKVGRVDTGLMYQGVEHQELKVSGKNTWKGSFGWPKIQRDYFASQEYGTGDKSGVPYGLENISPMHALTGALINFKNRLKLWL